MKAQLDKAFTSNTKTVSVAVLTVSVAVLTVSAATEWVKISTIENTISLNSNQRSRPIFDLVEKLLLADPHIH